MYVASRRHELLSGIEIKFWMAVTVGLIAAWHRPSHQSKPTDARPKTWTVAGQAFCAVPPTVATLVGVESLG